MGILAPLQGNSTHITGGEIVYNCPGSDNYELTLKLWKDCAQPFDLLDSAEIEVYYTDNSPFGGSSFSFTRLVYDTVNLGAYGNAIIKNITIKIR